jgi:hypothetical protein
MEEERYRNKKYSKCPKNYEKEKVRTKKRYFLRRLDNRAHFLHKRNVRRYNPRKNYDSTRRYFICNSPDHLSKTYPNKDEKRYFNKQEERENILIIDSVNKNILVCDDDIMDDESIYSIIEIDEIEYDVENESSDEKLNLIDELSGLEIEMMDQINCKHKDEHKKSNLLIRCMFCIYYQDPEDKATCSLCLRQACMLCLNPQKDRKNEAIVNTKYEKNKSEEAVSLEKDESKYINNIPQEFLILRLSFKTDQILSYFTQDIIYLIWKKC